MNFTFNSFEKEIFQNISEIPKNLTNKDFSDCTFKKCNFSDCDFSSSTFADCTFIDCNLSNIKVANCSFQEVLFENSKLVGVNFSTISNLLLSWKFKSCKLDICNFNKLDMKNSSFIECNIKETDFINTNLSGSIFKDSDLSGSRFQDTILVKADFVWATSYYIDPTQNKLKWARFSQGEVLALLAGFGIVIV